MCLISSRAWHAEMASLQLMNSAPSSASAADDMNALIIFAIVNNAPLLGGNSVFFIHKEMSSCSDSSFSFLDAQGVAVAR